MFWVFLKLGLTSFGGPVAHLGFFREEFVQRRRWLSDETGASAAANNLALPVRISPTLGSVCLGAFFALLGLLPWLAHASGSPAVAAFDSFYRAGSLVAYIVLVYWRMAPWLLVPACGAGAWILGHVG